MSKKMLSALFPAILSLLLVLGVTTVFSACDRREDGMWMPCHQCQNSVAAGGVGLVVLFGASAAIKNKIARVLLQVLAIISSIIIFFIPGGLCPMCMMKSMRCYTVFQPFTRVMSGIIAASGAGAVVASVKEDKRKAA